MAASSAAVLKRRRAAILCSRLALQAGRASALSRMPRVSWLRSRLVPAPSALFAARHSASPEGAPVGMTQ
eukprot:1143045-Lingulodinium_polyedra.AAC.1